MELPAKKRKLEDDICIVDEQLITTNKDMFCWGSTVNGELGLGGIEDENILTPREVNFHKANQVEHIACGGNYTVIITQDGQMWSCGNNDYGQLGHDLPRKRFQRVPELEAFVFKKAACGAAHTLLVNEWGQLYACGYNSEGQLGINSPNVTESTLHMVKSLGTRVVVQVACGLKHTLALTNNGELYSWGSNREGQLGLGEGIKQETKPRLITSLVDVPIAFIACGGFHSIVITKSGAVFGFGKNSFGQLGLSDVQNRYLPCQLRTLRTAKVQYAACGEEFSVFLTMDGGVFTCGSGIYGQLGHGNDGNEILPRKVVEMMGSVVTQISCGRSHTLAFVPSRGRVYGWGLGVAGQLGTKTARSVGLPQVVVGPWVAPNGSAIVTTDSPISPFSTDCVIRHIFSGADHCFATVSQRKDNIKPDDCRKLPAGSQILTIEREKLLSCQSIVASSVDHDLITYLETIFQNQACMNGSFLLDNDAHYSCSSKHHGVNIEEAMKLFGIISEIDNVAIKELIFSSITEHLIPSLKSSPPDVETLRIYLTLPLYYGFANVEYCNAIHNPFAKAVLYMKPEARRIVGSWWSSAPALYFERLVRSYKSVALENIQKYKKKTQEHPWDASLRLSLEMLQFLSRLNRSSSQGLKVPYDTFYLHELSECIDVQSEYYMWLTKCIPPSRTSFCDYPFIFDAHAKTLLLQIDQGLQMQTAMNVAATRAITQMLIAPLLNNDRQQSQFVMLNVSRENLVADTLRELSSYDSNDLKKPLKVKFCGEEAEDAGGVRKEFFMLLLKEILDPKYGMFKQYEETNTIWFSQDTFEDEAMYFLIGLICGLVIYNFIIINLPFPLALYKKLLKEPVGLVDVKDLSPVMAKSLQDLLDHEADDVEDVFCLSFAIEREFFGERKIYELLPNGSDIKVTLQNKKQYVDLYVDYLLNTSVESHFKAFSTGFHKVCGGRVLQLFHSYELMAVVVGNENYDWDELEKNALYKEGYTRDDPTIRLFWQIFRELSDDDKKKFLLFLTGSDRIPIQGMSAIKITIQPMSNDQYLPVAHTCFNLLDLPRYQTRERLRYKLLQAIQQTQGFSLV